MHVCKCRNKNDSSAVLLVLDYAPILGTLIYYNVVAGADDPVWVIETIGL